MKRPIFDPLKRIAGMFIALLLALLLTVQLVWWQHERIIISWPAAAPLFAGICAYVGQTFTPPRQVSALRIEHASLQQVNGPRHLELTMALRNQAVTAIAYPAIELTLLDRNNQIAIRRVMKPRDYLPNPAVLSRGLAAHGCQVLRMRLMTNAGPIAANFRVLIFYP